MAVRRRRAAALPRAWLRGDVDGCHRARGRHDQGVARTGGSQARRRSSRRSYVGRAAPRLAGTTNQRRPTSTTSKVRCSAIADAAVRRALDPSMVKLARIAMTHAHHMPDLGAAHGDRRLAPPSARRRAAAETCRRSERSVADEPELLAEHFLGMVAAAPARLASFGIEREAADQEVHTRSQRCSCSSAACGHPG